MQMIPVEPKLTEYLYSKASRMRVPISGTFELTPVCNMSCKMCYVRMTREQQESIRPLRTAKEWLELGAEAKENGMVYLLLTGGEPFLHPEIREIIEGLHKMGMIISINSNATMINENITAWLKESPPMRVNVTLYGASDETYGRLCNNPLGFTQAVRGIKLLRDAGIVVKINCSLTPNNVCDFENIINFCKENGLLITPTSYMFPPLRRDRTMIGRNERFTPAEAAYYSAKSELLLNGEERFLEKTNSEDFSAMPIELTDDCIDTEGPGMRCRAGKCTFWINWDGRMHPCGMIPEDECPNVFEVGFKEGWRAVQASAAAIRLPVACDKCPVHERCRPCAAMSFTETGEFGLRPQYRCEMAKAYPEACMKIRDEILGRRTTDDESCKG